MSKGKKISTKTIVGIVAGVLVLGAGVGCIGVVSKGFKDWETDNWKDNFASVGYIIKEGDENKTVTVAKNQDVSILNKKDGFIANLIEDKESGAAKEILFQTEAGAQLVINVADVTKPKVWTLNYVAVESTNDKALAYDTDFIVTAEFKITIADGDPVKTVSKNINDFKDIFIIKNVKE